MIAAISWVPKGVAKSVPPAAVPPSKEEIEEILKSGILERREDEEEEADEEMAVDTSKDDDENEVIHALAVADAHSKGSKDTVPGTDHLADALKELDRDNYDDEDDGIELFGPGLKDLYYASNDMDPYLKDKDGYDSEEAEDMAIKPEDAVIVCARNEDDVSHLEIWILEDSSDGNSNMYVHHDIIIPAFPLCTAWLDCPLKGGDKGNFLAVGSMELAIEIWDLDIMDEVQPSIVLGGIAEKKKKGKKKSIKYKKDSHTDSVLGLSWNKEYRNILASASADQSVKIWDVATGVCNLTMNDHANKVQAVAWNPFKPHILLSGSFDCSVCLKDVRTSHDGFKFSVPAQVESLAWDPHAEHSFVVSVEDGTVSGFDIRTADTSSTCEMKPSFTLQAHDKKAAVSSISFNPLVPNLLATGSLDKTVKLWDLSNNQPSFIASKNPKAGAVFSLSFSEDCPFLLAIGGSKGKLQMWDISYEDAISRKYGKYIKERPEPKP